ncbi:MAG: YciI family protein [Flavipsychrobacter sp.]
MIIIELTYIAALTEIDIHMEAHVVFLEKHYASGKFIASGRKVPRDGGIILATGLTKAEAEELIQEDPFYRHHLAKYTITEFAVSKKAAHLETIFS